MATNDRDTTEARAEKRRAKGLPDRAARIELARTYLTEQRRLWPGLANLGVLPRPTPKVLERMADGFRDAFLAGAPGRADRPPGLPGPLGAAYLRYSDDHSNPRSLDQQLKNVLERAARDGVFVPWAWVFADAAVTGTTAARTGYRMAKAAVADAAGPAVLYIDELGRASRDAVEALELGKSVQGSGKRLVGATDGFDSDTPQSKMMLAVFAMVQEWFVDQLRAKVKRGMADAFHEGKNVFGAALGYKLVEKRDAEGDLVLGRDGLPENNKVIDEVGAALVLEVLTRFAERGESPERIARWLNEVRAGGQVTWDRRRVVQVLTRDAYVGVEFYGKTYRVVDPKTGRVTVKQVPREKWRRRDVPGLRIVPDELWARAQARLEACRRGHRRTSEKAAGDPGREEVYPRVLVRPECGYCGGRLTLGRAGKYASFFCANGKDGKQGCRLRSYKSVGIVEESVVGRLRDGVFNPAFVGEVVRAANAFLAAEAGRPRADTRPVREEIEEVAAKRDRLLAALEGGAGRPASIVAQVGKHDKKLEELRARLKDMEARGEAPPPPLTEADIAAAVASDLCGLLAEDVAVAAPLLRRLTGPVVVTQEKVEGQRGAVWTARFTVDLVPVVAELARRRGCPTAGTWEFLHARRWTNPETVEVVVARVPKYERVAAEAKAMRDGGASLQVIAAALGETYQTVADAVAFATTGRRPAARPAGRKTGTRSGRRPKYAELAAEVVRLRDGERMTFTEIAGRLGVSEATATRAYDRGKPAAARAAAEGGRRPDRGGYSRLGPDAVRRVEAGLDAGRTPAEVAADVGCGVSTVYRVRRAAARRTR